MQAKSDVQLLREYACDGDEAAFREIVLRHTDLVYSSALRQTTSPDLAHDVAQSVFTDLARKAQPLANSLEQNVSLLGWLFRSTRFAARNQLRDARRRHARESQAMESLDPASETAPEWERLRSVLDGAMADLNEPDRDALLLRFFKNQDFRAIGESLGVSEDAAQKRVSRALDRLRAEFTRRGVTTTAVALSTALPANAVAMAPAGLAATLATAALTGTTIATTATVPVTQAIAMTALQKTLITAAFVAAVGTGIFQARQAATLRNQVKTLRREQAPLAGQIERLTRNYNDATNRLAGLRNDNERLNLNSRELLKLRGETTRLRADSQELAHLKGGGSTNNEDLAEKSLLDRVRLLKQRLDQTPEAKTPEFRFLTEHDWLMAADRKLDSDADFRAAFADLRGRAEGGFLGMAQAALGKYLAANNAQFPTDLSQLKTYFENNPPDEILQRYHIVPASSLPTAGFGTPGPGGDWLITQKSPDSDYLGAAGRTGVSGTSYENSQDMDILAPVIKACFNAAPRVNGNQQIDMQQLAAYLTTPEQEAAYQRMMERRSRNANSK
jgi:RNA polymerase sigma factor (sigma-70 family)